MSSQPHGKDGVEILCIGTELLLGNILNSNACWIAEQLAVLGLSHYYQTVVGDNPDRIKQVVLQARKRSRILITTGGLGPTLDDLTTETIAETFNTPLEEREEAWLDIQNKTRSRNIRSVLSNRKQALLPVDAMLIPNPSGTAPGMIWRAEKDFTILTFPGVPSELKNMWTQTASTWLRENGGSRETLVSRNLKISGVAESILAEELEDLLKSSNPTIAPYASLGEVKLRITAKASNVAQAKKLLAPIEEQLRSRTGLKCYGSDDDTLSSIVLELLRQRGETLGVAESCTGGGIGAALSAIPGASDVFIGGIISYSNSIKNKLLEVPSAILNEYGSVSDQVVQAMAKGARKKLGSDWAIAISGIAGPSGGSKEKPVGCVHIAVAGPKICETSFKNFGAHISRTAIQKLSVLRGLDQLRILLLTSS